MAKYDESEVRRLIGKLQSRDRPIPQELENSVRTKMKSQRRRTSKKIGSLFAKAGIDIKEIDKILSADQAERLKIRAGQKLNEKRLISKLDKTLSRELNADRQTATEFATAEELNTSYLTPYMITGKHPLSLIDDHIEPGNSWAKVRVETDVIGGSNLNSYLTFYFYWRNQNAVWAVVNAACRLYFAGRCFAQANNAVLDGGVASASVSCSLHPIEAWRNPDRIANPQISASLSVPGAYVSAEGGKLWPLGVDEDYKLVFTSVNLQHTGFAIPPNSLALFEVTVAISTFADDGRATVDFNTSPSYKILCPHLAIEVNPKPPTD